MRSENHSGVVEMFDPDAKTDSKDTDQAFDFLAANHVDSDAIHTIDLPALRRKIDWHIIPLMFACYLMNFIDRTILNVCTQGDQYFTADDR